MKKKIFLVIVDNITTAASAKQLFCQNFESIKNKKCRSNDSQISLTHLEKIQFKMSKAQNPKTKCPSFGDFKRIP
jgi:hypothetical protein